MVICQQSETAEHPENQPVKPDADLIVIGSGMGGLTVASLAAQLLGWRVLVLERHWRLGGFTHAFSRQQWHWDVGLHYVGGLAPDSQSRGFFDWVTGDLPWRMLPDHFDVLHLPQGKLALNWRETEQAQALIDRYPQEASAINRYFDDLAGMRKRFGLALFAASAPAWLAAPMRLWTMRERHMAALTTQDYMNQRFKDPGLKLAIACRWADYGLPPAESAFGIHAMVLGSYAEGAGRPEGGASAIAENVGRIVRAQGGEMRVNAEVEHIIIEDGKAAGVKVRDAQGNAQTLHAPRVVSDAGAHTTCTRLLADAPLPAAWRNRIEALEPRSSAAVLYLGLTAAPSTIGLTGENHWIAGQTAMAHAGASVDEVREGRSPLLFVSTASGESDGAGKGLPTAQVMVPMQADGMQRWSQTQWLDRGGEYEWMKAEMAAGLLNQVDKQLPGLKRIVAHTELSTPLTVTSMTGHPNGAIYGLAATPQRMREPIGVFTPVPGVLLTGADVCTPGIQGALMGGVFATAALIGPHGMPLLSRALARRQQS